jgi:hypothetical protein
MPLDLSLDIPNAETMFAAIERQLGLRDRAGRAATMN